jgi:hypothetical protein
MIEAGEGGNMFSRKGKAKSQENSQRAIVKLLPEKTIDDFADGENNSAGYQAGSESISPADALEYFAGEALYRVYKGVVKDPKDPLLLTLGEIASKITQGSNNSKLYLGKGAAVLTAYALLNSYIRKKKTSA